MRFGRWLFMLVDVPESRLDACYEAWARSLVGSPSWRSGIFAAGVIGWFIGSFMRGGVDVATRRAKYWLLGDGDFRRGVFMEAHNGTAPTWANKSAALLRRFGLLDWPCWCDEGGSYNSYRLLCGLVSVGHLNGRPSAARLQQCFRCGRSVANLWAHTFAD